MRGPSGIWNEETLPITEWEDPSRRVVIPEGLQLATSLGTPVLRWDAEKYRQVLIDHSPDLNVIQNLPRYLDGWEYAGIERHTGNLRVLFRDESGRWYAFSMGNLHGSTNAITISGSSRSSFFKNRLGGLDGIVERNE